MTDTDLAKAYDRNFYSQQKTGSEFAAERVVPEVLDTIRPRLWSDQRIPVWYRQNMMVFCRADHLAKMVSSLVSATWMDFVHPDLWVDRTRLLDQRMPRTVSILDALQTIGFAGKVIARRVASRLSMRAKD